MNVCVVDTLKWNEVYISCFTRQRTQQQDNLLKTFNKQAGYFVKKQKQLPPTAATLEQKESSIKDARTVTLWRWPVCQRVADVSLHIAFRVKSWQNRAVSARGHIPIRHILQKQKTHPFNSVHRSEPPIITLDHAEKIKKGRKDGGWQTQRQSVCVSFR